MEVKICGITKKTEIEYLNEIKVDYAGFVFFEKSKRNIPVEKAAELLKYLDSGIKSVAVVVSPDEELVLEIQRNGFDIIQIHGGLKPEILEAIDMPVWFATNISDESKFSQAEEYIDGLPEHLRNKIKALVVDGADYGSGRPFNWKKSKRLKKAGAQSPPIFENRKFILAGGLNSSNVEEGLSIFSPDIVDVSSGVEGEDGKEYELIKEFVDIVRK